MLTHNHCNVELSLSFIRNIQYNDNMEYCGLRSTGTSRIEQAKYNMDNKNIMMTNDLHVPVNMYRKCMCRYNYFNYNTLILL